MAARAAIGAALLLACVDEHLGVGTAGARRAGRPPPVVLARQAEDALLRDADRLPYLDRLFVGRDIAVFAFPALAAENRYVKLLGLEAEVLGEELERPGDRLLLEVVVQGPVAKHLEEGQVRSVAHLVDVAGPDALLDVREASPRRMLHRAHQVRDERMHPGRSEEDRRVVLRDNRCAGDDRMPLRLEKLKVLVAEFVRREILHLMFLGSTGRFGPRQMPMQRDWTDTRRRRRAHGSTP